MAVQLQDPRDGHSPPRRPLDRTDLRRVVAIACSLQFLFDATSEKARQTMLEETHVGVRAVEYDYQIEALIRICAKE